MSNKICTPAILKSTVETTEYVIDAERQEALLKEGVFQNAIFNSANFSMIATDEKGVIQLFNIGAERMLGYMSADVLNKITPADISDSEEVIARAVLLSSEFGTLITPGFEALVFKASRGIEDIYELTYIRNDGSRFPAIVSVTALRDVQTMIIGYLLIGTDNTERKRVEETLQENASFLNTLMEYIPVPIFYKDMEGRYIGINKAFEVLSGKTRNELIGKSVFDTFPPELAVIYHAKDLELLQNSGVQVYEGEMQDGDNLTRNVIYHKATFKGAGGKTIGLIGAILDITERKRIEEEQNQLSQRLRDHQFYTRSLFEANIDALMTTDPAGIITDVNKQMEALTDCTRDELIGAPFKNCFTDPDRAETSIKRVLSEKKITNYELTARARDGRETVVSYNATTFYDRERKLQGVFAAARDVTEGKRLDQVLQKQNIELESATSIAEKANLAKSEFLSSMSHELRSPLNAILGFAQLLESDFPPPTPAQQESIAQILKAGWHLLKLIDEILDLAKIESRKVPLSREPVSLTEIMRECQDMIEPQAQQRGIRMTFLYSDLPCFVLADRTRVKQILLNLLSNAIKYNSKQGTVEVDYTQSKPGYIRVNIRDSGVGLNQDQLTQLFQAFNRLGQEAGNEEGTGIGLMVAKQLVELMGGIIGVDSTVGMGSVFWFELLLVTEPHLVLEKTDITILDQSHEHRGTQVRTVLYVEDNPANLKLVEQIIARYPDLRLISAVTGYSGIEMAHNSQPEVILMDINLPGIGGLEALKILRIDPVTAHIPVIAISANAMPRDIKKNLEAGFFRYITKPIKVNEFIEVLDVALEFAEKNQPQANEAL